MFEIETSKLLKAAVAMQVAAMEWDRDKMATQSEARQALIGLREAINQDSECRANMEFITKQRRKAEV